VLFPNLKSVKRRRTSGYGKFISTNVLVRHSESEKN